MVKPKMIIASTHKYRGDYSSNLTGIREDQKEYVRHLAYELEHESPIDDTSRNNNLNEGKANSRPQIERIESLLEEMGIKLKSPTECRDAEEIKYQGDWRQYLIDRGEQSQGISCEI